MTYKNMFGFTNTHPKASCVLLLFFRFLSSPRLPPPLPLFSLLSLPCESVFYPGDFFCVCFGFWFASELFLGRSIPPFLWGRRERCALCSAQESSSPGVHSLNKRIDVLPVGCQDPSCPVPLRKPQTYGRSDDWSLWDPLRWGPVIIGEVRRKHLTFTRRYVLGLRVNHRREQYVEFLHVKKGGKLPYSERYCFDLLRFPSDRIRTENLSCVPTLMHSYKIYVNVSIIRI